MAFSLFSAIPATQRPERGPGSPEAARSRGVPRHLFDLRESAAWYVADPELVAAVNVALAVGAPLLLTGEPGCGKSQLAYHLAWYFNARPLTAPVEDGPVDDATWRAPWPHYGAAELEQPFVFHTKSTSEATDLLYQFETVRYFHDGHDPTRQGRQLDKRRYVRRGPLWHAFEALKSGGPAVVLVDEIDKAPRDFPNDLLHELSQYSFTVRETGETVARPDDADPPIVVVTSNEERRLPPAFLRRCIFHRIELTEDTLRAAATAHLDALSRSLRDGPAPDAATRAAYVQHGTERVQRLRDRTNLRKPPSTSELLAWLTALVRHDVPPTELERAALEELPFLGALLKDGADLAEVKQSR